MKSDENSYLCSFGFNRVTISGYMLDLFQTEKRKGV